MSSGAEERLGFYCPIHQLRFYATGQALVKCEHGGHALGRGFPDKSWWQYCCDCGTFWPSDPGNGYMRRSDCLVCERPTGKRYLCDRCQVVSVESSVLVRQKDYSIESAGIQPRCPGCASQVQGSASEHSCRDLAIEFLTRRSSCPFCENSVQVTASGKSESVTVQVCPFCGAEAKPGYKFCRKCGKPQSAQVLASETLAGPIPEVAIGPEIGSDTIEAVPETTIADVQTDYGQPYVPSWESSLAQTPPKRRTPWIPAVVAVALTITVVIMIAIVLSGKRTLSPPPNLPPNAPPGMVYIPGGDFTMGNDSGDEYEKPAHRVTVKPFFMDINEVTCEEYEEFIKATGHRIPPSWTNGTYSTGSARKPVTGVDWYDANYYAQWAKKRLPTEEEWEFAARGSDGRKYPWGNEWRSKVTNAGDSSAGQFTDIGSYPEGKSPFGLMDMVGNAWEWTATDLTPYPGGQLSDDTRGLKVIRGGYWGSSVPKATTTFRRGWDAREAQGGYKNTGLRCAKDIEPNK